MNASKVLMGVLGGVAVGAVAGILFAPAKGTKTRKRIMKKGNNLKKDMKNKFEDVYKTVSTKYDSVLDQAKEFAGDHQEI
ncbi:YtxH domain-containing protein [Flavobacterium sp.]|jgi:gas vesicle protein|uniref:YtxH domain-containing protein n=1 Tax=Flavobacterium sp. TaxID=239 RepID=UPI0037BFF85D